MNLWQRILAALRPRATASPALQEMLKTPPPAGRVSTDSAVSSFQVGATVLPPSDASTNWRLLPLDLTNIAYYSPHEMIDLLVDISPEISYAVWQFQRLLNPGFEVKVYRLGPGGSEHVQGKKRLDEFFELLKMRYKSVDVPLGRLFMGAYLRGAFCAELVLDSDARTPVDLATPDPYSIRFRKKTDPVLKEVWEPGQMKESTFVSLDIPTFCYVPVDPAPASPYGRSLVTPAIFPAIFSLSLLYDIKRVVMQQGYKRMDVSLNTEAAMDSFSYDQQGYATLGEYMRAAMDAFKETYRLLEPDDALIHTDLFDINAPAGTVDSDSMGAIDNIIERLEKQLSRALKTVGVVLGTTVNRSEADANRQWELQAAGVKSLQHYCENLLETLLTLALQVQGIQARVEFRFAELRAAEMLRDAQTLAMGIANAEAAYQAGFVTQDEAANMAVNHDAAAPGPVGGGLAPEAQDTTEPAIQDNSDSAEETTKPQEEVNRIQWGIVSTNGHSAIAN